LPLAPGPGLTARHGHSAAGGEVVAVAVEVLVVARCRDCDLAEALTVDAAGAVVAVATTPDGDHRCDTCPPAACPCEHVAAVLAAMAEEARL
jgi:uncharacterized Zn finger protein